MRKHAAKAFFREVSQHPKLETTAVLFHFAIQLPGMSPQLALHDVRVLVGGLFGDSSAAFGNGGEFFHVMGG